MMMKTMTLLLVQFIITLGQNLIFNLNIVFSVLVVSLIICRASDTLSFFKEFIQIKYCLLILKIHVLFIKSSYISVQHSLNNRLCVKIVIKVQLANYFISKPSSKPLKYFSYNAPKHVLYFQILYYKAAFITMLQFADLQNFIGY